MKFKDNSREDRMRDYTLIMINPFQGRKKNISAEIFEGNYFGSLFL